MTTTSAPTRIPPDVLRTALIVMAGGIVVGLDATMTNVALDTFLREFRSTLPTVQWIGTAYLLAMTMAIPVTGWAIDRFGARRMWLLAVGVFLLGSLLCAAAGTAGTLIAARVLQGVGGGMIMPLSQAIIARAAGPRLLGRVMAALGVPAMLGPVLGPVVGGVLLDHAGWRWIFLINIPVCGFALVAAARLLPRDAGGGGGAGARLDLVGLALLPTGCAGLVYGLAEAGRHGGFIAAGALLPMLAGVVLLSCFVLLRRDPHRDGSAVSAGSGGGVGSGGVAGSGGADGSGGKAPMPWSRDRVVPLIDVTLFRHRSFAGPVAVIFLSGVALFGAIALVPLYLQQVRGASALEAGLLIAPQGLGMGVALIVAGRLADRLPPRPIVLTGLTLAGLSALVFTRLDATTSPALIGGALVISGLGLGATLVPVMATPLRTLPPAEIPRASTAVRIFQQLGGSFAGAIVAVALQRSLAGGDAPAEAFAQTFWWPAGAALLALVAALLIPATHPVPRATS